MNIVRSILRRIYLVYAMTLFTSTMLVVFLPVCVISLLPEPSRARKLHVVFKLWMGFFMPIVFCPVKRNGTRNFKKGEQYVVVLNHNSFVDGSISSPWIPGPNKTLLKVEIAKVPLFGKIFKTAAILVDRKKGSSRQQSLIKMQEVLDMGIHLCLYPEGTRNNTNDPLLPFHDGAFIVAIKAQKPVMPGVIFNTRKILPVNKKLWATPNPIRIDFLEPIPTAGLTLNDLQALKENVHRIMADHFTLQNK